MITVLVQGDKVMFVDFVGEGHRDPTWPPGYMLTHGLVGEVIAVEPARRGTVFSGGGVFVSRPERYQIAWNATWFYKKQKEAHRWDIPTYIFEHHGPVEWAHKLHIIRPEREEVRRVADIRKVVEQILHTQSWEEVLKGNITESPVVKWLKSQFPKNADEGKLPGDTSAVFRKASAYAWVLSQYEKTGDESLTARYTLLRDAALNEMVQKLHDDGVEIKYPYVGPAPRKENGMAAKPNKKVAAPTPEVNEVPAKAPKTRKEPVKPASAHKQVKERFTGDHVTAVLRETEGNPKAIVKAIKEAFEIVLDPKKIADAPNSGIMKMRAGNIVRGQLRREDRLV